MAEPDPLTDLFGLLATPIAGTIRSVDQFRRGVDEFLKGVENFNRTMENLNDTAERVNVLLGEVEEPLRAAVPQVTRTVKTADQMMQVVSGPAMAAAPALERMASIMSSPEVEQIPRQMQQFTEILTELSGRLAPLTQLAGSAGGLFGGLRIPGFTAPGDTEAKAAPPGVDLDARAEENERVDATVETDPRPQHDPLADVLTEPPLDDSPARTSPPTRISRTTWGGDEAESSPTRTQQPAAKESAPAGSAGKKKAAAKSTEKKKSTAKKVSTSKKSTAKKSMAKKSTAKKVSTTAAKKTASDTATGKSAGTKKPRPKD